jgi:heme exporter protein D
MQWQSLSEFIAMGGYAGYVWGSVGVTAAAMLGEALLLRRRRREAMAQVRRQAVIDGRADMTGGQA